MSKKKNNQAKSFFSFKNDDADLVELGQFIRDTTSYRVEREWYVIFDKESGKFVGYSKTFNGNPKYKPRNPDLLLIDKKSGHLDYVLELDGDIHRIKESDTEERNNDYENSGIRMIIINMWEIDTTIFDYVNKVLEKELGDKKWKS